MKAGRADADRPPPASAVASRGDLDIGGKIGLDAPATSLVRGHADSKGALQVEAKLTPGSGSGPRVGGICQPPLVSLVVINWNYAAYVGAAIDSIRSQDYPALEAIIVDNGSTDGSRDVIAKHIGDDPRFRVITLETNLGQLGAFLEIFPEIRGEFATIVDADDVLFANFVSSHVQVHLALPFAVAFTSSNVVEMNADGRALSGSFSSFGSSHAPMARGLRPVDATLRLSTISAEDYRQLDRATSTHVKEGGWFWGPGTSNMYRRSVLALAHQKPRDKTYFRAADSYLNQICHVLGASALIDRQLSAYRLHDANYFSERESVYGLKKGRSEITRRHDQHIRELILFLFQRAAYFSEMLPGGRFWRAIDQLALPLRDPTGRLRTDPDTRQLFIDNYATLRDVFGEADLIDSLHKRLHADDARAVVRGANGGRLPARLALNFLRDDARSVLDGLFRRKPVSAAKNPKPAKGKAKAKHRRAAAASEDAPVEFGPVAALSTDPPIFLCGIAYDELLGIAPAFGRAFGSQPAAFLIYPCWTIEDPRYARRIAETARAHALAYPAHELVFMCNTAAEAEHLRRGGLTAHLLNKNFTVSDTIFRPLPDAKIEFDAIYNARLDPRKRHALAARIERVALVSYVSGPETPQAQRDMLAGLLARRRAPTLINPTEDGLPVRLPAKEVNAALNRAAVGLCLSAKEGSNYASVEYMLAGLPVVSTPSRGGREIFFDHEYCTICDPNPAAVREAVKEMQARNIPRDHIRARTLAKIEPERRRFLSLIDDLSERLGGPRRHDKGGWPYGEENALVTWKPYQEHLRDFERGFGPPRDDGHFLDGEMDRLLGGTEAVQMQRPELRAIAEAIRSRRGCSLLIFGCGNDSVFWEAVNRNGTTAFVEDDPAWMENVQAKLKAAAVYLARYDTRLSDWISLLNSPEKLALALPDAVTARRWDVVIVDGPPGYLEHEERFGREAPGRMKSIYMASTLVAPGGCVFVHDCDRVVERQYAVRYLGADRLFVSLKGRALLQGFAF